MTLQSLIAADATDVFLDTSDFARSISRNPAGVTGSAVTLTAIVFLDDESGLQGSVLDTEEGRKLERWGRLEISEATTVLVTERPEGRDTWTIDGKIWNTVRVEARDGYTLSGLQTVIIQRVERIATAKPMALK